MNRNFAILATVAVVFAALLTSPTHSQKKKPVLNSSAGKLREWTGLPLELRKGAKIQISGSLAAQSKSAPVTVKEVIGHWVYLEGVFWVGGKTEKEGWVNFNQIAWFRVVKANANAKAKK